MEIIPIPEIIIIGTLRLVANAVIIIPITAIRAIKINTPQKITAYLTGATPFIKTFILSIKPLSLLLLIRLKYSNNFFIESQSCV